MKVVTYNLHKGRDRRGRPMLERALAALAAREPDLLLCQEVFHSSHVSERDQCDHIADVLGMEHVVFGANAFYRRGCHGNAVFSRRAAIETHRNIDATESWLEKRGILHASVRLSASVLDVFCVHFSLTGRQRRRQWDKLVDALPADSATPVLVGGDFNDWRNRLDVRARRQHLLANALWHEDPRARRTFPAHRPALALDRLYVRNADVTSVEVLSGKPWVGLSDHLPVETTLSLGNTP